MRLLISGGGTGGHVYPALAVAAAIQKRHAETPARAAPEFLYVGRAGSIEERLAGRARIPFQSIQVGGVRSLAPWIAARNLVRLARSAGRARRIIREFRPEAVFVTGGYVSAPIIWASAAERVPSVVYLPDLEPGWAVTATARWATRVAVSFPEAAAHFARGKAVVTGYPVRPAFLHADKCRARQSLGLDMDACTVTILGGSRGAHHINTVAAAHLEELARGAQLVHITGRDDEGWVKERVKALPGGLQARVRVFGYLDEEMPTALAAADVAVARAGAATLGEFPALGLPAVLVPYPYAGQHQERNADFLVKRGAALKVPDAALEQELVPTLHRLLDAPEQLKTMSQASGSLARPEAAETIAELLASLAEERR